MTPEERFTRIGQEIEKQNEGIRSLIVVARTCLDSIKEMRQVHDEDYKRMSARMEQLNAVSEEKLNILVETVDRIIRRDPKANKS